MYAIRNKRNGNWLYGTDYRQLPLRQLTSSGRAITFPDRECAEHDMRVRRCSKNYEVVKIEITIVE